MPWFQLELQFFYLYDQEQVQVVFQEKGFMNEKLFNDYFFKRFIPHLQQKRQRTQYNGAALLLMDNLLVHKKVIGCDNKDSYIFLPEYNLHVLFIVPHSSDQTQPLDLGIFANQKRFSQNVNTMKYLSASTNMLHKAIVGMQKASTLSSVVKAFEAAGIVRKVENVNCKIIITLKVDKTKCTSVRHYNFEPNRNEMSRHRVSIV